MNDLGTLNLCSKHCFPVFATALLLFAVQCVSANPEKLANDESLISFTVEQSGEIFARRPDYVLTHADMDRFALSVPQEHRAGTLASMERLAQVVDNLSVRIGLSKLAMKEGLLSDRQVQAELLYAVAARLSELYIRQAVSDAELEDYSLMAEEMFLRDPMLFSRNQRRVSFEQILIAPESQEEVEALAEVVEVHRRLEEGEEFQSLILEFSDDPQVDSNSGLYSAVLFSDLEGSIAGALDSLDAGEISQPLRSPFGWHFVRLVEQIEPERPTFDEVRDQYLNAARSRHQGEIRDSLLAMIVEESIEIPESEVDKFLSRHGADAARQ